MVAKALTIAGSDSGGGAGIQADLKAFSARGVFGTSAITAVTAQNTQAVTAISAIPISVIEAQIKAVLDDIPPDAIKVGMLGDASVIKTVAKSLEAYEGPIVLDPVMVAKSGDALLAPESMVALREEILPRASVLTPNLPEAATLLGVPEAQSIEDMIEQGEALRALGARAVLMKGGHGVEETCHDLLIHDGETAHLTAPRQKTKNTHGTGCTLSSALAAELAKGASLTVAFEASHSYLQRAMAQADSLAVGSGHGPVHHFCDFDFDSSNVAQTAEQAEAQ